MREATYIGERCFARLLEIARPGIAEREIGAEMYKTMYMLGGEDPLFLTMSGERLADGRSPPAWNARRPRPGTSATSSSSRSSSSGRSATGWSSRARSCSARRPTRAPQPRRRRGARGRRGAWCPARGRPPSSAGCSTRSGPRRDVATGRGTASGRTSSRSRGSAARWSRPRRRDWKLTERMVLAMHPMVQTPRGGGGISYLANSYIVTPGGGEAVSKARSTPLACPVMAAADPILASVLQRRVVAVSHEMATVLMRSSRSPIFNEIGDLVTVVFDRRDGRSPRPSSRRSSRSAPGRRCRRSSRRSATTCTTATSSCTTTSSPAATSSPTSGSTSRSSTRASSWRGRRARGTSPTSAA